MNTEFQKRFLEARRDMFRAAALDNRNTRLGCALIEAAEKDLPRFTETEFAYYQAGARWPYADKYRIHFYTGAAGQDAVNHFKSLAAELGDVLPAIQDWLPFVKQESMRGATGQIRWVWHVFDVAIARSTAEVSHPATPHEAAQSLHGKWKPDFFRADIEDMFTSSADSIDIILENANDHRFKENEHPHDADRELLEWLLSQLTGDKQRKLLRCLWKTGRANRKKFDSVWTNFVSDDALRKAANRLNDRLLELAASHHTERYRHGIG